MGGRLQGETMGSGPEDPPEQGPFGQDQVGQDQVGQGPFGPPPGSQPPPPGPYAQGPGWQAPPPPGPYGQGPGWQAPPPSDPYTQGAGWQPPPPAGPYLQANAGWPQMAGRRTNSLAIAALCCGIGQVVGGPIAGIAAIVLGAMSLRQIETSGEDGRGMAITGLVLGIVGLIVAVFLLIFIVALFHGVATNFNSPSGFPNG